jgi:Holliday junction resolvase RusA-like endonuclease
MYARRPDGKVYKKAGIETWQTAVARIVQTARPSGWLPTRQVRLYYDFHLVRRADCDNLQKALNDAIAHALGVNDDIFLPCARSKTTGADYAFVEVTVENVDES